MNAEIQSVREAWDLLDKSVFSYEGRPVGTVAALDGQMNALNYNQCFVRDFVPVALAYLMRGEQNLVRHFLETTLALQSRNREHNLDYFGPSVGIMPASFKVEAAFGQDRLVADFGDHAIGRVTPVDAILWWMLLLRVYVRATGDTELARREDFQLAIRLIMELCLVERFEMFPTLLVPDGAFMIDRRMGVYGHPLEIQALFFTALLCARELLVPDADNQRILRAVNKRIGPLAHHIRSHYWLDVRRLNEIYRFHGEEFGPEVTNPFNLYPDAIPRWLTDWLPDEGGFLVGNLGPSRMDYRFFAQGNYLAAISGLATFPQAQGLMSLVERRWDDLVGYVPMKICYPALEGLAWKIETGSDPKNTPWSYHNGGNWPVLLWSFTLAAMRTGQSHLAVRALELMEQRVPRDGWPEYYDGRNGRLIGKESRGLQTWTIAGYLVSRMLLEKPEHADWLSFDPVQSTESRVTLG